MFPYNFVGLWSLLDLNMGLGISRQFTAMKIFSKGVTIMSLFLKLLQYRSLILFCIHYHNDLVADNIVPFYICLQEIDISMEIMFQFVQLFLDIFELILLIVLDCLKLFYLQLFLLFLKLFNLFILKDINELLYL